MNDISEGDDNDNDDNVPGPPKRRNDAKLKPSGHASLHFSPIACSTAQFPWHHPTPSPTITPLAHTSAPDWTDGLLFPRAGPLQTTTATTQAPSPSAEANSEGTDSTGHADPHTNSVTHPQVHNTHPSWAIPLHHPRSSLSNPTSIRPHTLLLVPRVLDAHLRPRARVALSLPITIAECTPTTNCARVLPVAGVVVEMEADNELFAAFIDGNEPSGGGRPNTGGTGLDWLVHGPASNAPNPVPNPPPSSSSTPSVGANKSGNGGGNWLDLLSGNYPTTPSGNLGNTGTSWERGDRVSGGGH
ncbi:uncharacterized protein LACBIDRAFT_329097 [Laccaria bicolor S238N-H82]|uniref:Predicted protein n=1 Tax=Laccaria bicolor (strain S238N-H82 / ATCC MYA-4686) TaxID=486041 RepID=B0DH31_LACBS|nr:uncharacterized protein LACBIDRAFT_329097 [Laccaria bicolor S238N-H82]EDR06041.1 predicted protein [Laccaria bicolor S238N-H82]|eukprot:XP_001883329.1 predicted protein [Laccaria bicolor S238N-H82]